MELAENTFMVKASVLQVYLVLILLSLTSSTTLTTSASGGKSKNFGGERVHRHGHTSTTNVVPVSFRHNTPPELFRGKSEFPTIHHAFPEGNGNSKLLFHSFINYEPIVVKSYCS